MLRRGSSSALSWQPERMSEVNLAVEPLLAEARERAGLDDFGDPRFREGLEVLLATLDQHLVEDEFRAKQRESQLNRLVTRLQIQEAFNKHPEILDERIEKPMVVTGLPRSGTSALFNLLDADPDARGLLMWETVCPQPNEALQPGEADPRYTMIKEYFEANRDADFQKIHFVSADTPEECCVLHVYSFDGVQTGWEILLEPYCSWFKQHDLSFLYEEHHKHLKLLQWQRPRQALAAESSCPHVGAAGVAGRISRCVTGLGASRTAGRDGFDCKHDRSAVPDERRRAR